MSQNAIVIPVGALRRIFVMLLVLIGLILLVLVVRTQLFRAGIGTLFAPSAFEVIDRDAYQAVFLAGGQVFFGKLQEQGDRYFVLRDVFYLSVPDQAGTQGQLIKRGNELHGPEDLMIIPVDQVLFIENMRDDSEVANVIRRFKSGQLPIATAPPLTAGPTRSPAPSPTR